MAHIDWSEQERKKVSLQKYNDLKKHITTLTPNGGVNEFYKASEYMTEMENKIKKQEEKINQYRNFFYLLKSLLPQDI